MTTYDYESLDDPWLNLLARVWGDAFERAPHDRDARMQIVAFFGIERCEHLHREELIGWDPHNVQMSMYQI